MSEAVGGMTGENDDPDNGTAPAAEQPAPRQDRANEILFRTRNALATAASSLYLLRRHIAPDAQTPAVEKHLDRIEGQLVRLTQLVSDLA